MCYVTFAVIKEWRSFKVGVIMRCFKALFEGDDTLVDDGSTVAYLFTYHLIKGC